MDRISAAENTIIDTSANQWRLISVNEDGEETLLLNVAPAEPLQYNERFARTRRMPTGGTLPAEYVWQVVLGWSQDDEAWHLGLLLARDLADARGSRWCQLAFWPDPDTTVFIDLARQAGEKLANTLGRPFRVIPRRERKPVEAPLPDLPINIGMWRLESADNDTLQFVRSRKWVTSRLLRALWYLWWIVVYVVLSITTLDTDLALPNAGTMLPNPEILPYLGLGAAAVLGIMILYIFYEILTKPNRIVIDGAQRQVTALRGNTKRWQKSATELQSIYVTQVVNKKGSKRTIYHGEINLHLGSGDFHRVIQQLQQEEDIHDVQPSDSPAREAVLPLTSAAVISDLQAAGLHVARILGGLPVWYDQRVR